MGKETYAEKTLLRKETRESGEYCYEYTLSVRESRSVISYRLPLYSISIKMSSNQDSDERELCDCFADIEKATRFFELLVNNLATPANLIYVFEDRVDV